MATKWTTINGGAPVGDKLLDKLNPSYQVKYSKIFEAGARAFRSVIGKPTVANKIELGRICNRLKKSTIGSEFRYIVEAHWLEGDRDYESVERELQDCQAMYQFSKRRGPKLITDIPIDSYRKIMQHVRGLKDGSKGTLKTQNKRIREINETRAFGDISLEQTKKLREVLRRAKLNLTAQQLDITADEPSVDEKNHKRRKLQCLEAQIEELQDTVNEILQLVTSAKVAENVAEMRDELSRQLEKLHTYLENRICS